MDDLRRLRVSRNRWNGVLAEILARGREGAGFLVVAGLPHSTDLVVDDFLPIPDRFIDLSAEHGLAWDAEFNLMAADRAGRCLRGLILIHAHPTQAPPRPSSTDRLNGESLLRFLRRELPSQPHGLAVLGERGTLVGGLSTPDGEHHRLGIIVMGNPLQYVPPLHDDSELPEGDRQYLAFGEEGFKALGEATIAVVGLSGGGSHVAQQLVHAGVGTLVPIDPETVDASNLRRLVGARLFDVDVTPKVEVAVRLAGQVRPSVKVRPVKDSFPSRTTLRELGTADIIIGCVDDWLAREGLNEFALRHRIPYIDIGATIVPPAGELGPSVFGQIAVVIPSGPCLRCMGLLTDILVERSRKKRQGYGDGLPDPQVVSINGTLASEAVTAALLLLAGQPVAELYRRYECPPGTLEPIQAKKRKDCRACIGAGL